MTREFHMKKWLLAVRMSCLLGVLSQASLQGAESLIDLSDRTQIEKRRPILIAHRGGIVSADSPECSLVAIRLAAEAGYAMVELDVQRSRDDVPIVFHDDTLEEACGLDGSVDGFSAVDLVKIRYTGSNQKIVTLDSALAFCRELNIGVMLDLKAGLEDKQFLRRIDGMIVEHKLVQAAVTISRTSTAREELRHVMFRPTNDQLALFRKGEKVDLRGTFWFGLARGLKNADVARLQESGALVIPAVNTFRYPNDPHQDQAREDMKRLLSAGVDGFQIDSVYTEARGQSFEIQPDYKSGLLEVYEAGASDPVVTQNARKGMRPYLHPIRTLDGKGVLTEIHPIHHLHQTGIYWGLKKVNGRDFFKNNAGDYYRYRSLRIIRKAGETVRWETVYDLIDEHGDGILRETQTWSLREEDGFLLLDLEWRGKALVDVKVEKFFVGGLFMRMPWTKGIAGEAINSMGERNRRKADGHRSEWVDVGMEISGIEEWGHIAILEHPDNVASPTPWRVDEQLGIGPSRQILGNWHLGKDETTVERFRLLIYTGELDKKKMDELWKSYASESQN